MSALNFQRVMAHLLRFPTQTLDEVQSSLGNPELTALETSQLVGMYRDPLVQKYGYKLRFLRRRDSSRVIRLTSDFVDSQVLDRIYFELFEPPRVRLELETMGLQFLEFCLTDPGAREILDREPSFVLELMEYELAKAISELRIIDECLSLPQGSLLRHGAFTLLDLDFDIPTLDRLKVKNPEAKLPAPQPKPMKIVILTTERHPYTRVFQVDAAIERFLRIQLEAPSEWGEALPAAYSGMVGVGLCRELD